MLMVWMRRCFWFCYNIFSYYYYITYICYYIHNIQWAMVGNGTHTHIYILYNIIHIYIFLYINVSVCRLCPCPRPPVTLKSLADRCIRGIVPLRHCQSVSVSSECWPVAVHAHAHTTLRCTGTDADAQSAQPSRFIETRFLSSTVRICVVFLFYM